jgi:branched-chain amino acid transport system ATP-binding protein
VLRIRNLESGYGKLRVLKGISMHVDPGEIVAIIGGNGSGKSTLLETISHLINALSGEIIFDKTDIRNIPAERIVELGCTLVPEGRLIFDTMTVSENLSLGAYSLRKRVNSNDIKSALSRVYDLFPILRDRRDQVAGTLSGGEQQMLAIGRALMARPKLIMLDEPSMGLAPIIVKTIFEIIIQLRKDGHTILLVEQNARAALGIADRGYVLETGQIVLEGTSEELFNNNDVQRAYLGKDYKSISEVGGEP